ncbi:MAG: hypothetical protein WC899_01030 [bacterium]
MDRKKQVSVWERTPQYKKIWGDAARALSAEFVELSDGVWEVRNGAHSTTLYNHIVQLDDPVVLAIADNKPLCFRILKEIGLPVPGFTTFRLHDIGIAKTFMEENEGMFVVKPAYGTSGGMGITTHIRNYGDCRNAAALASLYCRDIVLERLIPGESYRVLVLDGEVIHASRRRGVRVEGDGRSTIAQLMERANQRNLDGRGRRRPHLSLSDPEICATLQAQRFDPGTAPGDGRSILLKSREDDGDREEIRTAYNEDATETLCEEVKNVAIRAAEAIHSRFAGVDIITADPAVPLGDTGGAINEVNTTPGMHNHYDLDKRNGADPAAVVLRCLLKLGPEGK